MNEPGFVRTLELERDKIESFDVYPYSIPAIRTLERLDLDPRITFLVGENGSGKSTLIEALAVAMRFNAEGGSKNFSFSTHQSESNLHTKLRVLKGWRKPRDGFFLRAESYYNVATKIAEYDAEGSRLSLAYGGPPHEMSHGESFLALANNRFGDNGLYILDEPEAALSPQRQLSLLSIIHRLVNAGSQFIIASHSPILMAYPGALIYQLSSTGIAKIAFEETEHYTITRDFLANPERYFAHLFRD
jgi:predicted ATPase